MWQPPKEEYVIFYCKTHEKSIYFFKSKQVLQETICWDCIRDANLKRK